mmetsp:Transcript_78391/g.196858  ORF Transcript_78391/g.196858 Transcript_78391/m.196858 type:complete len:358 (+) Transcript_78391:90-1163(+)
MAEQQALRRLRHVAAAVVPVPCVATAEKAKLVELEGESIARLSAVKVALLRIGERGVPLGSPEEVDRLFQSRGLVPVRVRSVDDLPADAEVVVTTGAPVGSDVLQKMPKLKLVAVAFTGTDHIDVAACKARRVAVAHVPGYSTDATAELAIGLVISHLRRLQQCHQLIKDGQWSCPPQEDLRSKTVGIIGVGKIGLRLAELFNAFHVRGLIGYSTNQDPAFAALGGVYVDTLAALFLDADIVCVCVPLTETSEGMVSDSLMGLLRSDSLLVNVSRGGVIDELALAKHLGRGSFRAALDVFSNEPLPKTNPLRQVPPEQLLMTPHVGYQSQASLAKRLDVTVKNVLAHLAGQATNIVA